MLPTVNQSSGVFLISKVLICPCIPEILLCFIVFPHIRGGTLKLQDEHCIDEVTDIVKVQGDLRPGNFKDSKERCPRHEKLSRNVVTIKSLSEGRMTN